MCCLIFRRFCFSFLLLVSASIWKAPPQPDRQQEKLHGVISRHKLTPELRSPRATLRYSHDGRYLLVQDPSGIYVLSREPLTVLGYIEAPNSYPAVFSAGSRNVVVVSRVLSYTSWRVVDGESAESKELPISSGCIDAQLSPDGTLIACYRPDFAVGVLQISTGQWLCSEPIQRVGDTKRSFIPISLDLNAPFSGPFGFAISNDPKSLSSRAIYRMPMSFSPDGSILIAGNSHDTVSLDVSQQKSLKIPNVVRKTMDGSFAVENRDQVLVIPPGKPDEPSVRTLTGGNVISNPKFSARFAVFATDVRYALLFDSETSGDQIFDLQEDKRVEARANVSADVYDGELALLTTTGEVQLYKPGDQAPVLSVALPVTVPPLRGASVTAALDKFAVAVDGAGGLFQIPTGQRISDLGEFSAVSFTDPSGAALLTTPRAPMQTLPIEYVVDGVDSNGALHATSKTREVTTSPEPQKVLRIDETSGKSSLSWSPGRESLGAGGPVFLDYSFDSPAGKGMLLPQADVARWGLLPGSSGIPTAGLALPQGVGIPFRLRALDPATGKELWSKSFPGLPPIPFADAQGERLILSWPAKSAGAWGAAKHYAPAKRALSSQNVTNQDSFIEILEARTGKAIGGVLVQGGAGSLSFDSLFSVGDFVIALRDAVRVCVYSISDGELNRKLLGARPSANAQSALLALLTGPAKLEVYDLKTTNKVDEFVFASPVIYTHFSADGQRLFALTDDQTAFVFDMKNAHEARLL